jgi:hypothetical protein
MTGLGDHSEYSIGRPGDGWRGVEDDDCDEARLFEGPRQAGACVQVRFG